MKIIIPMAGRGTRLRPHTLTTPKPLIPIAGKPIVHRLLEELVKVIPEPVEEVAFIIGDFGENISTDLLKIAKNLGLKGVLYQQETAMGTAHALHCAELSLNGPVVIAFADTLFRSHKNIDTSNEALIWVKQVEDPSAFGVVKTDQTGNITAFIEKPKEFVSDLAIIGIYYIKEAEKLANEIKQIIDNNLMGHRGEYQLTDALENLRKKGISFKPESVSDWMDCGNKDVTIKTNAKMLQYIAKSGIENLIHPKAHIKNSLVIPPCFIGAGALIENAKIGPNVSIGNHTKVLNSNIENSLIQGYSEINHANLTNTMVGNHAQIDGKARSISIGDFSSVEL